MTAKGIMDVYKASPFIITIPNLCMVDAHLHKKQGVGGVANAPEEVVHIHDERFSLLLDTKVADSYCSENAVHYEPNPDCLE